MICAQLPAAVDAARQCVAWDPTEETRAATEALLKAVEGGDDAAKADIIRRFGSRISFGTAGLRGPMGHGTALMNDLVCLQASQGLAAHLIDTLGEEATRERGVVIGYDHRTSGACNSERFALLSAAAMLHRGIKVYLYNKLVCTPLVPFGVRHTGAGAGIMVTASHNPKMDNGYKVYWGNGCQIIPPVDAGIAAAIGANQEPWAKYDAAAVRGHDLCIDKTEEIEEAYLEAAAAALCRHPDANVSGAVKIAYTAMHGVGHPFCVRMFERFHLPAFVSTPEQQEADPEFPTVEFPNPEEGKGALACAMATADGAGATLILANDPDADRLAVAERQEAGEWRVFTGNELGAILGAWQWEQWLAAHPGADAAAKRNVCMIASTVSSKMLGSMAAAEGFRFFETLTGFKWLGNKAIELREEGAEVLLSFEQAIGFCVGNVVDDKDGVTAAAVFAEMAHQLHSRGLTIAAFFASLQEKYGYFLANDGYVISRDRAVTDRIFERIRNGGRYWLRVGRWRIAHIRDLTDGVDTSTDTGRPTMPVSKGSHMITFTMGNGAVVTLRTSGTEPKLKYYCEMGCKDPVAGRAELDEMVHAIVEDMLQPEENGLERMKSD